MHTFRFDNIMSVEEAFAFLKAKTESRPKIGVVCGSGLSGLAEKITDKLSIDYKDIPNFPVSTVQGHKGCLVFGKLGGKDVICMQVSTFFKTEINELIRDVSIFMKAGSQKHARSQFAS